MGSLYRRLEEEYPRKNFRRADRRLSRATRSSAGLKVEAKGRRLYMEHHYDSSKLVEKYRRHCRCYKIRRIPVGSRSRAQTYCRSIATRRGPPSLSESKIYISFDETYLLEYSVHQHITLERYAHGNEALFICLASGLSDLS